MNIKAEKFLARVFPFLILGGFLGRGVFNVMGVLTLLLFSYIVTRKGLTLIREVAKDNVFRAWLVFVVLVFVSNIFSIDILHTTKKFISFALFSTIIIMVGLYLFKISERRKINLEISIRAIMISVVFISILMVLNMIVRFDILRYISKGDIVHSMSGYHFRFSIVVIMFIIPIYFIFTKKKYLFALFLIFLESIAIVYSESRTALISFFISVFIIIMFFFSGKMRLKIFLGTFLALLFGTGMMFYFSPSVQYRLASIGSTFSSQGDRMAGRLDLYEAAINEIKERLVTGYGVKSATRRNLSYQTGKIHAKSKHPHNVFLEILLDSGLIGLLGFLYFLFVLIKETVRVEGRGEKAVIVSSLLCIFLTSMSSWSIWSANHITVILIVLTILIGISYFDKHGIKSL
jgi:O-antigen ligase